MDMGRLLAYTPTGLRMALGRYGEFDLPMLGVYEIENASLAVWGAGNVHARLDGIPHSSPEYVQRVRQGLETIVWYGRCQRLQTQPDVYIDGAINPLSAKSFVNSLRPRLKSPVVTIAALPTDRDAAGVYHVLLPVTDTLILTQTTRNVTIKFPDEANAVNTARTVADELSKLLEIHYAPNVAHALDQAKALAGSDGTVLMAVAQPAIGDAFEYYGLNCEQL
jgi:dihydrofolate synthase/folylpolyglutamate synthase